MANLTPIPFRPVAQFNRRVAFKAAASFAAMVATVRSGITQHAAAQNAATSALTWVEGDHPDVLPDAEGYRTFTMEAPFSAIAPNWDGAGAAGIVIDTSISFDGTDWTAPTWIGEAHHDAGPPDRDGRRFGELLFADGASHVRYRALDSDGALIDVPGLAFSCIDSSAGPSLPDAVGAESTGDELWQPPIIARAAWGANETYRFDPDGKIFWPQEYQKVEHVIVHHTVTPTFQDPLIAMRAIYYYHAVERGWGDIGYNYLVDHMGNVYEGRAGGENVVGGHAYQYAHGSSGIGLLGEFSDATTTPEAQAGLVWIRDFGPGIQDVHRIAERLNL